MANNDTFFSTAIEGLTAEESSWLKRILVPVRDYEDQATYARAVAWIQEEIGINDELRQQSWPSFAYEFEDDGRTLALTDDGGEAVLDDVVALVQAFLKRFRPGETFGFEWALTCTRPIRGEFGGGAALIRADSIEFCNTGTWLSQAAHSEQDGQSWFTVVGFFADNEQRWCDHIQADTAQDAEDVAIAEHGVIVCAVIAGRHCTCDSQQFIQPGL